MENPFTKINQDKNIIIKEIDDGPTDLAASLPINAKYLKTVPGPDRPDYKLFKLEKPILLSVSEGSKQEVFYFILCSYLEGMDLDFGSENVAVSMAYVIDESLLEDSEVDFDKTYYAAIGNADFK